MRATQVILISLPGGRRFQQRPLDLGAVHMSGEDRDNRARHLVLDRKNVVQCAVVPLGPAVGAGHRIDELGRDTDQVAAAPDAKMVQTTGTNSFALSAGRQGTYTYV
jgi:hypothetical protein